MGKTPSSHIIHSLEGEYCWIVRDSEPIRLLKLLRSLRVYILMEDSEPQAGRVMEIETLPSANHSATQSTLFTNRISDPLDHNGPS